MERIPEVGYPSINDSEEEALLIRFTGHRPGTDEILEKHNTVRLKSFELALWVKRNVPKSRQQALALTHLEEVMMWTNKGIAENQ